MKALGPLLRRHERTLRVLYRNRTGIGRGCLVCVVRWLVILPSLHGNDRYGKVRIEIVLDGLVARHAALPRVTALSAAFSRFSLVKDAKRVLRDPECWVSSVGSHEPGSSSPPN
jgi:hypothetical protein